MRITFVFILTALLLGCSPSPSVPSDTETDARTQQLENLGQTLPISAKAIINREQIELEVAQTPEQQAIGLMYRTSLSDNRGMLFPFDPPQITAFWMKNTKIPLDMIFLRDGVVRAIEANVPPCQANPCPSYGPQMPIDAVLELRGGRAAELSLKEGDRVEIRSIDTEKNP
jgi:hypothetical protein